MNSKHAQCYVDRLIGRDHIREGAGVLWKGSRMNKKTVLELNFPRKINTHCVIVSDCKTNYKKRQTLTARTFHSDVNRMSGSYASDVLVHSSRCRFTP